MNHASKLDGVDTSTTISQIYYHYVDFKNPPHEDVEPFGADFS